MQPVCFLHAVDDNDIGRLERTSLPQQTLMEMLVHRIEDTECFRDKHSEFNDISRWKGVTTDDNGNVTEIDWDRRKAFNFLRIEESSIVRPGGNIDFQWLPATVVKLLICDLKLTRTVETACLPRELEEFYIMENQFRGTFSIETLPESIDEVIITKNLFSGSLNIPAFPRSLVIFEAAHNQFSGCINLSMISDDVSSIDLSHNSLSGEIDLQNLPTSMRRLKLQGNTFRQEKLVVREFPKALAYISVDERISDAIVYANGYACTLAKKKAGLKIMPESK